VHHCYLIQNSAANAIWNCQASAGLGHTYMAECQFYFNRECEYVAARSINAWYLNGNGPFNINDNWWFGNVCFNQANAITDIALDGNAVQFIIDTPSVYGGGQALAINAGGATRGTLIGSPASYTLTNGAGVKVLS
jgi:hypothetical protein